MFIDRRIVSVAVVAVILTSCSSDKSQTATSPSSADSTSSSTVTSAATTTIAGPAIAPPRFDGTAAVLTDTTVYPADVVASELQQVESAISDPLTSATDLESLGFRQQSVYRAYGRLDLQGQSDVLVAVDDAVLKVALPMTSAGAALRNLSGTSIAGEFPSWTVRQPDPVDQLKSYYVQAGTQYNVPWTTLAAINFVETRFGRIVGPSNAGAIGPMQFLASSWNKYGLGGDITDDRDAIFAAANFLAQHDAANDLPRAIYAYNPSDEYVTAIVNYMTVLDTDPRRLNAMYGWQVIVRLQTGDYALPVGWTKPE